MPFASRWDRLRSRRLASAARRLRSRALCFRGLLVALLWWRVGLGLGLGLGARVRIRFRLGLGFGFGFGLGLGLDGVIVG